MRSPCPGANPARRPRRPIPIVLLTGFLGSGKTTLLQRALGAPDAGETAVLVNEFGSVGLDHHLLWNASEFRLVLENGCICCSVSDDFLTTLEDLFWQRLHRAVPYFTRVVIETTGLADAGAIKSKLASNSLVAERYELDLVVSAVDAQSGERSIESYAEARAQIAAADRLIITKIDLGEAAAVASLTRRLSAINSRAKILHAVRGDIMTGGGLGLFGPLEPSRPMATGRPHGGELDDHASHVHSHTPDVVAFTFRCRDVIDRQTLEEALHALVAEAGERLLRIKGIVRVTSEPARLLVQVAGSAITPLQPIADAAPDIAPDLVVVGCGVREAEIRRVFARRGLLACS